MSTPLEFEKAPQFDHRPIDQNGTTIHIQRSFRERLSLKNIAILILGTIAVIGAFGFLLFVWVGAVIAKKHGEAPRVWRVIINYLPKAVTICTAVIRIATGLQLSVLASVFAALILERVGVSREDFPQLSMIRCSNNGPLSLIWNTWHSRYVKSQIIYSMLIIFAIFNSFALQFMSPILMGDFGVEDIVVRPQSIQLPVGLSADIYNDNIELYEGNNFWKSSSTSFPAFAEYTEAGLHGSSFVDTGMTYRAFIPLNSTTLLSTQNYSGPATVLDMRVICTAPKVTNFSFVTGDNGAFIMGTLEWTDPHHQALRQSQQLNSIKKSGNFIFTSPDASTYDNRTADDSFWALGLGAIGEGWGELSSGLRTDWDPTSASTTQALLLFNMSSDPSTWTNASFSDDRSTGVWASYEDNDNKINTTLCFINPTPHDYRVKLGGVSLWQTSLGYNQTAHTYTTGEVMAYLDGDRDLIYDLEPSSNWEAQQIEKTDNLETADFLWKSTCNPETPTGSPQNGTWILSPYIGTGSVYRTHYTIAQDVLKLTGDPALALQGLFTIVMQTAYQEYLVQFGVRAKVETGMVAPIYMPLQWTSFIGASSVLFFHFFLLTYCVISFLRDTEASLLGSNWQAILQVVASDTKAREIQNGHTMTDKEIRRVMEMGKGCELLARRSMSRRKQSVSFGFEC